MGQTISHEIALVRLHSSKRVIVDSIAAYTVRRESFRSREIWITAFGTKYGCYGPVSDSSKRA